MEWTISATQLTMLGAILVVSMDVVRRLFHDRIKRNGYPLPPGPTPVPFLGSALSVNVEEPFRTYTEWRAKYGDIVYIRVLDMDVVVLNSPLVTSDLLEKRSQLYSNRPYTATFQLYGQDNNFIFAQYSDHFRLCRRIFHQTFGANAAVNFHPMQLRNARQMIPMLIDDHADYISHYRTFAASIAMRSIYDYEPKPKSDEIVSVIDQFLKISLLAMMPGKAALVKNFPFLLHVPDWFPGSSIKHEARKCRQLSIEMVDKPYQYVKKRKESAEDSNPSMVSEHMTHMETLDDSQRSEYEKALKRSSSSAFLGSVETTRSILIVFTLAMVKNPHVWKRAQAEIDAVVGNDRLPEFYDRPFLPYVDAILRETLRWEPVVPLGVPHAAVNSDIYNGFYIPKGATVIANIWGMTRDESRYPDAEKFSPERFLDADGKLTDDTVEFIFGFGRRICPGRYTGDASLWSAIVTMLATLDFNFAKDAAGKDVIFEVKWENGLARHPIPFPCSITPRLHINKKLLDQLFAHNQ